MPSASEWSKRVKQWRDSGKSAEEFALMRGWKPTTLKWWSSELQRRKSRLESVQLVPVSVVDEVRRAEQKHPVMPRVDDGARRGIAVELRGARIRVERGFDVELLRQVVDALERT